MVFTFTLSGNGISRPSSETWRQQRTATYPTPPITLRFQAHIGGMPVARRTNRLSPPFSALVTATGRIVVVNNDKSDGHKAIRTIAPTLLTHGDSTATVWSLCGRVWRDRDSRIPGHLIERNTDVGDTCSRVIIINSGPLKKREWRLTSAAPYSCEVMLALKRKRGTL